MGWLSTWEGGLFELQYSKKQLILLVLVVEALGIGLFVYDYVKSDLQFQNEIWRKDYGGGDEELNLRLLLDDEVEEITLEVSEAALDEEEAEELVLQARSEIDETFLGENESLDQVWREVNPEDSYVDGQVEASWTFSDYSQVSPSGEVTYVTGADPVLARVELTCSEYAEIYEFYLEVVEPDGQTTEGFLFGLEQELERRNLSGKDSLLLPEEYEGRELSWKGERDYRGLLLMIMGLVLAFLLPFARKEEEKRAKLAEAREYMKDYPEIVSLLSLYVGAGLSLREACNRIALGRDDRPGFALIRRALREMEDGRGELEAYERMGQITDIRAYRKLSQLLAQNLRRGNQDLRQALEHEADLAYEERVLQAKVLGEEASTKLLFPMMLLLGVVIIILIFPAWQEMGG